MSERSKFFLVGIFVFCALIAAGWLFLFLHPSVGDGGKLIRVRFSNIEKIVIGTRVNFAGRPVGEVVEINEIYDARDQPSDKLGNLYFYELVLRVDSSVKIYNYDEIIFSTSGLLGERTISILPKATPAGKPAPHEVTNDILYARSTDPLTDALQDIKEVASSFECTLDKVGNFLDENREEAHRAISSFAAASDELRDFVSRANDTDLIGKINLAAVDIRDAMTKADTVLDQITTTNLIPRMGSAFDTAYGAFREFHTVTSQLASGEGTLGRLLFSDNLYLQINGAMGRLETTLSDINNYGLLFQYNRKWQRQRALRQARLCQIATPCDFYAFFDQELQGISGSLNRVSEALNVAECSEMQLEDPCFAEQFRCLLEQVNVLQENLNLYTQKLSQDYYQKCYTN